MLIGSLVSLPLCPQWQGVFTFTDTSKRYHKFFLIIVKFTFILKNALFWWSYTEPKILCPFQA